MQQVTSFCQLLKLFCQSHSSTEEISKGCNDYLAETGAKGLLLLLDGFDEFPEKFQKEGIISDILKHQLFPECSLVVLSCPHASVDLRKNATRIVNILGFTNVEQKKFINAELERPQSDEVIKYLESHLTISSLCFTPFNMIALLYIYNDYKQGIKLPRNSTELLCPFHPSNHFSSSCKVW